MFVDMKELEILMQNALSRLEAHSDTQESFVVNLSFVVKGSLRDAENESEAICKAIDKIYDNNISVDSIEKRYKW